MAITQDRMLALINAAKDYRQALEEAVQTVQNAFNRYNLAPSDTKAAVAEDEMGHLGFAISQRLLVSDPIQSATTIAIEEVHFRKQWKRNKYEAKRNAALRAAKRGGALPSWPQTKSAPQSLRPRTAHEDRLDRAIRDYDNPSASSHTAKPAAARAADNNSLPAETIAELDKHKADHDAGMIEWMKSLAAGKVKSEVSKSREQEIIEQADRDLAQDQYLADRKREAEQQQTAKE